MSDAVLNSVAENLSIMRARIEEGKRLISIAQEAGEDVTALKVQLAEAESRMLRWRDTMRARGYQIPD